MTRILDVGVIEPVEIDVEPGFGVGDRVWVVASTLSRGKARGSIIAHRVERLDLSRPRDPVIVYCHHYRVKMERAIRVPRIAYLTAHTGEQYKRLIEWHGKDEIEVPERDLEHRRK